VPEDIKATDGAKRERLEGERDNITAAIESFKALA
jgi:hypothetical protein